MCPTDLVKSPRNLSSRQGILPVFPLALLSDRAVCLNLHLYTATCIQDKDAVVVMSLLVIMSIGLCGLERCEDVVDAEWDYRGLVLEVNDQNKKQNKIMAGR